MRKIAILMFFIGTGRIDASQLPRDVWIWAGIQATANDDGRALFILQGAFDEINASTVFVRQGLGPSPLMQKRSPVILVFRLRKIVNPAVIARAYSGLVSHWAYHGVRVIGLQIDYDSATDALPKYGNFLLQLRGLIGPGKILSITALADWLVSANGNDLGMLANACDEIVFQLYHGRHVLPKIEVYIAALRRLKFPFKIGLLESINENDLEQSVSKNSQFKGSILFRQKR